MYNLNHQSIDHQHSPLLASVILRDPWPPFNICSVVVVCFAPLWCLSTSKFLIALSTSSLAPRTTSNFSYFSTQHRTPGSITSHNRSPTVQITDLPLQENGNDKGTRCLDFNPKTLNPFARLVYALLTHWSALLLARSLSGVPL